MTVITTANDTGSKSAAAAEFVERIDSKLNMLLVRIESSEFYRKLFDAGSDSRYVGSVIKWIMLEVYSYGEHVAEATFTAISRLPKTRPDLMQVMLHHEIEEVAHAEMALQDFIKMGGDEQWARTRRMTPASWAMAGVCRLLSQYESPFAYLGYMYIFEALTPILTARVQQQLAAQGIARETTRFIDVHAVEDIAHSKVLKTLIQRVVRDYPQAASAIEYGFDCFECVYPLPIWQAAADHARQELQAGQMQSAG